MAVQRNSDGTFRKGTNSPNPGGRPKSAALTELARQHSTEAVSTLVEIMQTSKRGSERIQAATALLDRAFGRPAQALQHSLEGAQMAILGVSRPPQLDRGEWMRLHSPKLPEGESNDISSVRDKGSGDNRSDG